MTHFNGVSTFHGVCPTHSGHPICVHTLAAHGLYVHALPGRLRVEVPEIKDNPEVARQAESRLAQLPGVRRATCSPHTGRALIEYDPRVRHVDDLVVELFQPQVYAHRPLPTESLRSFASNSLLEAAGDMVVKLVMSLV